MTSDRHEDQRGVIQDLLTGDEVETVMAVCSYLESDGFPVQAVTRITTKAGGVRGNHTHQRTHQWTYILSGRLRMALGADQGDGSSLREHGPSKGIGTLVHEPPGIAHAWKALEDTVVLVFTHGPRSGTDYESDTTRLDRPLLVP